MERAKFQPGKTHDEVTWGTQIRNKVIPSMRVPKKLMEKKYGKEDKLGRIKIVGQ